MEPIEPNASGEYTKPNLEHIEDGTPNEELISVNEARHSEDIVLIADIAPAEDLPAVLLCSNCQQPVAEADRFCSSCGAVRVLATESYSEDSFMSEAKPVAAFYIIVLLICIGVKLIDDLNQYKYMFWVEVTIAIFTFVFAGSRWHQIAPLYSLRGIKPKLMLGYSAIAVVFSLLVGWGADYINAELFKSEAVYILPYLSYPFTAVIFLFSIAVYPAIVEELGFRGYVFDVVRKLGGTNSAIFISSVTFAVMHLNIIGLIWLVPFALWLGYLRYKHETLWYGMVIHFMFNATTAVIEMIDYGVSPFNF